MLIINRLTIALALCAAAWALAWAVFSPIGHILLIVALSVIAATVLALVGFLAAACCAVAQRDVSIDLLELDL